MVPRQFTAAGFEMMQLQRGLTGCFIFVASMASAADRVDQYSVASPIDGQTLQGEIDQPAGTARAIVVMFPGSGTHTRDYPSSLKGSPRSFVFRDLSNRLVRAGFATVRYDERGLRCTKDVPPDAIGRCFNDHDAMRINWDTLHADALAIYRQVEQFAGSRCIIALGHSEGVIHIGGLIARGEANPIGVVAVSGSFSPIARVLRYQLEELIPRAVEAADSNQDGLSPQQS